MGSVSDSGQNGVRAARKRSVDEEVLASREDDAPSFQGAESKKRPGAFFGRFLVAGVANESKQPSHCPPGGGGGGRADEPESRPSKAKTRMCAVV